MAEKNTNEINSEELGKVTGGFKLDSEVYYTVAFAKTNLGTFSPGSLTVLKGENVWVSDFNANNSGTVKFFNRFNDVYFTPAAGTYSTLVFTAYDSDANYIGTFNSNQSNIEVNCNTVIELTTLM